MHNQLNIFCPLSPMELKELMLKVSDFDRRIFSQSAQAAARGDREALEINHEIKAKTQNLIYKILHTLQSI